MESLKKHGDPLEDEVRPHRGAEVVNDNDPGSKGTNRAGEEFVRSRDQKPNPVHPDNDATMELGGDLGQKRNTM